MSNPPVIANAAARAIFLERHLLAGKPPKGARDIVAALGFVQIDSIRIVERAQHHILHARDAAYRPNHLHRLHARERAVFEQWTHDASLIPMAFYPHWRHRFAEARERMDNHRWWRERLADRALLKTIRDHVERNGPTRARDFETKKGDRQPWWGWAPHKAALEYLWYTGVLATAERDGFEKVYDLTERVIPADLRDARPTRAQSVDWAMNAALDRLGFATAREMATFWDLPTLKEAAAWTARGLKRGEIVEVAIEPADGGNPRPAFLRPETLDAKHDEARLHGRVRALAPFDPALRDRARAGRLFGLDYRVEIFTPAHKRTHGYYVFPILEGGRFVARLDLKADRTKDTLTVRGAWMEPGVALSKGRRAKLEAELARLARLAEVGAVDFPETAFK